MPRGKPVKGYNSTRKWFADSKIMPPPRISLAQDRRRKMTVRQIEQAKKLYGLGWTTRELGRKYKVSKNTISYHVIPGSAERMNARARARNRLKWRTDKDWKLRKRVSNLKSFKRMKKITPGFRKTIHEYEWRRRARKLHILATP